MITGRGRPGVACPPHLLGSDMHAQADVSLLRHRKVRALARDLEVDRPTAVGLLVCLWIWAIDQAPDGTIDGSADPADFAEDIGWRGDPAALWAALVSSGWVDEAPDGWAVHDWREHTGGALWRRAKDAARKRRARADREPGQSQDVPGMSDGRPPDVRGASATNRTEQNGTEQNGSLHRDPPEPLELLAPEPAPSAEPPARPTRDEILRGDQDNRKPSALARDRQLHEVLLECWAKAVGKVAPKTGEVLASVKLTQARRRVFAQAFADGYAPSLVLRAIEGIACSDWHMGRERGQPKRYDDLAYALRERRGAATAPIEKFSSLWEAKHGEGAQRRRERATGAVADMDAESLPAWQREELRRMQAEEGPADPQDPDA